MSFRAAFSHTHARSRLSRMASQFSSTNTGASLSSLTDLPKSNVFTSKLPPDPGFPTPEASHQAQRERLYPRLVKGAFYTFVRPETTGTEDYELLGVSPRAMQDIGLKPGEENTNEFKDMVTGNKFFWDEQKGGVYPWAQCYGGMLRVRLDLHEGRMISHLVQDGNCTLLRSILTYADY